MDYLIADLASPEESKSRALSAVPTRERYRTLMLRIDCRGKDVLSWYSNRGGVNTLVYRLSVCDRLPTVEGLPPVTYSGWCPILHVRFA